MVRPRDEVCAYGSCAKQGRDELLGSRSLPSFDVVEHEKMILRMDTEPSMLLLRRKVQLVGKASSLETELQDIAPDVHQGLQVERWVQTVRNLSKTLIYGAEL